MSNEPVTIDALREEIAAAAAKRDAASRGK